MIVIGLGSGRTGTASLAKVLGSQKDAICFHEMNPSCVRFFGTPRPIMNTVDEFAAIVDGGQTSELTVDLSRGVAVKTYDDLCRRQAVSLIGDVAHYYLSYVESIFERNPSIRMVCLRRDREQTIASWLRKTKVQRWPARAVADRLASWITREPYFTERNPWMEHDGRRWLVDPVWDKCFPKFSGPTRRDAVGQYWDYYYAEAERLRRLFPESFIIVETDSLGNIEPQKDLLSFCGVDVRDHVYVDAHIHLSRRG